MDIYDGLISELQEGVVQEVRIGLHWTAVVVVVEGVRRCGLASTLMPVHEHHGETDIPEAGRLQSFAGRELAEFVRSPEAPRSSIGMAAVNALLPPMPGAWVDANAEEMIARMAAGGRVALVGHFPFIKRLKSRVGHLSVLERNPSPGDLPEEAAPEVIAQADVLAITSMTLINHSLMSLLNMRKPSSRVLLLGPSTPLSPSLFAHGIQVLSGSVVTDIDPVLRVLSQGGTFRQVHRAGVRLVNLIAPDQSV